ncbi:Copper transporter 1 [Acorus calamus]|uniref:Copper transport protein n=1 Tax=Acorus calamus TaxID=4465 RepID=A0AAV9ED40_ACOCL|nr:Copper transporter 1 [Acorus calamus]
MEMDGHDGAAMGGHDAKPMMMHMTFFWGKDGYILFHGWPGERLGMYVLALVAVFVASVAVEWLGSARIESDRAGARVARTVVHAVRVGLAYLVMLALMSFNVGVFIAAVAGHAFGFMVFSSRVIGGFERVNWGKPNGGIVC